MNTPQTMHAIVITQTGNADVLQVKQRALPGMAEDEVMISVKAAGVNRPDVYQRMGGYPAPKGAPDDIPGLEVAGDIVAIGADVIRWKIGDKVCALISGGGYADFVNAPEGQCLPIPKGFSYEEAAALPETFFTVWSNVFDRGNLQQGQSLLVHGGSSGIGVAAIQMAVAIGCKVYTTAGTDEKCAFCESIGAALAVNYKKDDFETAIYKATGGKGVHVVLDMVGSDYTQKNLNLLHADGSLVIINAMKESHATIDLKKLMVKRLKLTGSTLRARSSVFKAEIAAKLQQNIWPLLEAGKIKAVIDMVYPMADAKHAHKRMESSDHIGKIILKN